MKVLKTQTHFVKFAVIALILAFLIINNVNGEDTYDRGGEDRPNCSERISKPQN